MGGIVKNQHGIQGARRLFITQLVLTLLLATANLVFIGHVAAVSALLGGAVSIVPSALFAAMLFRHQGARAAKKIVHSFYKGEAMKLATTVLMFALVFKYFIITPLVFFVVYIVAQMVIWFAPIIFDNSRAQ